MSTLLALLDAFDELPQAADLRHRSYRDLGDRVVDVGCGGGRAVAELTEAGATAIGVDADPEMIAVAARRRSGDFRVGDAAALPLDDASVTGYRADKVLHALDDPSAALAEATRVLRPGGRATLTGQDWDGTMIDSDDPELTRRLVHARADGLPHPRVARQYRNLLLDHGFRDVTVEGHLLVLTGEWVLPLLSGMADGPWFDEQVARAARDRLLLAVPVFLATGTR